MNPRIESLEKMLDGPRDNALLRFSLGNEYLKAGAMTEAANCFRNALERDPNYSAAWKALGKEALCIGQGLLGQLLAVAESSDNGSTLSSSVNSITEATEVKKGGKSK